MTDYDSLPENKVAEASDPSRSERTDTDAHAVLAVLTPYTLRLLDDCVVYAHDELRPADYAHACSALDQLHALLRQR